MKFERLRLSGFKTFVDATDVAIEPGLTGIVGPNGCGKSNLVEALRWVMGETSSKSLRGAGMEDVIFAGSATRPERNQAEVSIRIGEPPEDLGGHLNGAGQLDIVRRIVREQGSTYRVNGREVRARDVQILFADAASGARSPSLVRQGQIGEIIAAKPQHRRRILEDAAGVAGLHARRHEAELRLAQAETNLARAEDVLSQLDRQIGDLRRQARQSERYKALSAEIRTLETALMAASLKKARAELAAAEAAAAGSAREIAQAMVVQGEVERARAVAEHEAEAARAAAARAHQAQQALVGRREALDSELGRIEIRLNEIARRRLELDRDREKAARLVADAAEAEARLAAEAEALGAQRVHAEDQAGKGAARLAAAREARQALEADLQALQAARAEAQAARRLAEERARESQARAARLANELALARCELETAVSAEPSIRTREALDAALAGLAAKIAATEAENDQRTARLVEARQAEQAARPKLAEAERLAQRLETEARTIRSLVEQSEPGLFTRAIDKIVAEPGYEAALGAALGDDLEAALDAKAPRHWAELARDGQGPALPEGAPALARFVTAPAALQRRLAQIGVVDRAEGARLQPALRQGQRLVSTAGDLWRWDGFTRAAEAPSTAARRLAERNRLASLEQEAASARSVRDEARAAADRAFKALRQAQDAEAAGREALRKLTAERESANAALQREMRASEAARLRLEALKLKAATLETDHAEAEARRNSADAALADLPAAADPAPLADLQSRLQAARQQEGEALAANARMEAEIRAAAGRLAQIAAENRDWRDRAARAEAHAAEHGERMARLDAEADELEGRPAELALERRSLADAIDEAAMTARSAADALARAETALRTADEAQRAAFQALAKARENAARLEAERDHAAERLTHFSRAAEAETGQDAGQIEALLQEGSAAAAAQAERAPEEIEARVQDLKRERERLGAVNLRADIELAEIEGERTQLADEREEIAEAIRRFRRAIETLNGEGRKRLRAAFDQVNAHFSRLFTRLFGGGEAELQLVEADDPLEAGLEILAKPPGKRPQLLSLLSGGEQALTATALIFAVFLTNPSPICVLDEVDAPLDDSNVERLCDLLADMARETATRFLVITHNPISMARMDRLYGVTMVEKGVSQLVSVDLVTAEKLAEAV